MSDASWLRAFFLYFTAVSYCAITSGIWQGSVGVCGKLVWQRWRSRLLLFGVFAAGLWSYVFFILHFSTWFLGCTFGYPLLSPTLPLVRYQQDKNSFTLNDLKIVPLTLPEKPFGAAYAHRFKPQPDDYAQAVFSLLKKTLRAQKMENGDKILVVIPESAFPFALDRYLEVMGLWNCALKSNHFLLVGTEWGKKGAHRKGALLVHNNRIKKCYDKCVLVDGVERSPRFPHLLAHLFPSPKSVSAASPASRLLTCGSSCRLAPLICAEMFFTSDATCLRLLGEANCALVLVNDSWFSPYIQELLLRLAIQKTRSLGVSLMYVAHSRAVLAK